MLTERFDEASGTPGRPTRLRGAKEPVRLPRHRLGVASIVLDDGLPKTRRSRRCCTMRRKSRWTRAAEEIRARFGDGVARIVEDCTDSWETPKRPWAERKLAYTEHARTLAPSSLRVSAADKVHNTYTTLRDLRNIGEEVWGRFNASADDIMTYYGALVRSYREAGGGRLVDELSRIVRELSAIWD